ncbi:A disintegrin and metalloproteinase with thrombospondin motifs 16-like [Crotalus adamanteus]|uniref:A disintegrin and metalloproteinase with thrombospondin motifs 16-like n=1 Tax=Crotalus adamanteus TaxID=8729 RepID=A0AAW1BNL7_CROAD
MPSNSLAGLWFWLFFEIQVKGCVGQTAEGSQHLPFSSLHSELLHFTDNSEYDIVTAYEVNQNGDYISHAIAHHERRKRSTSGRSTDSLHLHLQGFGHDFQLDLKTSNFLVAPGFTVQTLGKGRIKSVQTFPTEDFCFYQGILRLHKNSTVALSTCGGLSGLIRTQETDYFLKPLPPNIALKHNISAPGGHRSHVLYKRSTETKLVINNNEVIGTDESQQETHNYVFQDSQPSRNSEWRQKQHFCGRRKKYMPQPPGGDTYILPDEYKPLLRNKRSLLKVHKTKEFNVETLVVVDKKMMQNHGYENITTYVLTVLNMPGLVINHHADHTLSSFCQWQSGLMGKDGSRHDHAILLTGFDICSWKNEPCDTLGFAPISGMCSKYRSCTINEDTGLGLAFTVAHESGHNSPQSLCLADQPKPVQEYKYPEKLPGELYDATIQCKWQFGEKAKLCMMDFKKWCRGGQCVKYGDEGPKPIHGHWSEWSSWSSCSRTCGGGISHRERNCSNPRPSHRGKFCEGSSRMLKLCNIQKCPPNSISFRAAQCAEFNSKRFRGWHYKWKPYTQVEEYYTLVTIPAGARSINVYEMNVSNSYIAVRTSNKKYHLNGYWTVDWPGKYKFAGTLFVYQRPHNHPETLSASGPTNESIVIELLLQGKNLGIAWEYSLPKVETEKTKILKHNYTWAIIRSKCSVSCGAGQMVTKETCYKDFQVQVDMSLCDHKSRPATGAIPCKMPPCPPSWSVGNWSGCSLTCGGGERFRGIHCMQRIQYEPERVSDSLCQIPAPVTRELCNTQRCPPTWSTGPWSECSVTCGKGIQRRTLNCAEKYLSGKYRELAPKKCSYLQKPNIEMEKVCILHPCYKHSAYLSINQGSWFSSSWSQCTVTCGGGMQVRSVQCLANGRSATGCLLYQKPIASQACNINFCPLPEAKAGFSDMSPVEISKNY